MKNSALRFTLALLVMIPSLPAWGQAADATAPEAADASGAIHEVSPGIYEMGAIRIDQKAHTVRFPGAINMDKGPLEYLLVGKNGPTHESLLVTEIAADELHTAMLLLGAKGAKVTGEEAPAGQLTKDFLQHAPKLAGDSIEILAAWRTKDGKDKSAEVADLLRFVPTNKPPARGPWLYTGSLFGADGKFLAKVEDIFGALVTNPAALINNPRTGNDDDREWDVNDKAVPPAKTPVTISIRLLHAVAAPEKNTQ